ncbi:Cytochrome P450 - like 10 [Theobroma cacao]|nr:Cytochrome P450 - like 10 [Theobroma cacao]
MSFHYYSMLLLVTVTTLVVWLLIKQRKKTTEASRLPPGPRKLPILGNLHQLGRFPHLSIQFLSQEYGPLMFLQLGSVPTIVISSADMARAICKSHDIIFSGRPPLYVAEKISYNFNDIAFGPYGETWRKIRKIAVLELLSSKRVQSLQAVRDEEVSSLLDHIACSSSGPVNLSRLSFLLTINFVCRVAFGKRYGNGENGSASRIEEVMHETLSLLGEFVISDYFPWMRWLKKFDGLEARVEKNFRELDKLYDEVIKDHLDQTRPIHDDDHEDIVDALLRLRKDPGQRIALTNQHIKGVLMDMFLAGTDTGASTIVWTMAELMKNPSAMKRAQDEVREVVKGKMKVEESDLHRLTYLKAVIKEALRLHPPVPLIPRETMEDCTIGDYTIPAKTRVFIDLRSISTDPKCWENPCEFQPDRFLNSPIDFKGQHFELIPFGIGRRGCPGLNFAIPLIELALAHLLHRFEWKLPDGVEDLDMEAEFGLTVYKKTPLCLVATTVDV